MIHRRLSVANDDVVYDDNGNVVRGCLFVGDDSLVRWFPISVQHQMEGVGEYMPAIGYMTYEDSPVEELVR